MRGIWLEGEEEEAKARGFDRIGGNAIVLVDHVIKVFIGGDRDEGVEVLVRELVFEGEGAVIEEGLGEARREVRQGGVAVDDDDAGVTADVTERLIMRARDDVAAVTTHEAELGGGGGVVSGKSIIPRIGVAGARGRV